MKKLIDHFAGEWLPLLVCLSFYGLTTVIGALWFMTASGRLDLVWALAGMSTDVGAVIGSPTYLALLLLPFVIMPILAYIGIRLVRSAFNRLSIPSWVTRPAVKSAPLVILSIASVAFCFYRLHAVDALIPTIFDSYEQNIVRRTELMDSLGVPFFLITYGFLPMLCVIFFARFISLRRMFDLFGFIIMYVIFYMVIFDTLAKSHLLVVAVMLTCAVLISRSSLVWIPTIAAISFGCFLVTTSVLNGVEQHDVATSKEKLTAAVPPPQNNPIKNIIYRMATSYPFYVHIFNDPEQRCGLEAHTFRKLLHVSPSKCVLPTKIYSAMSPEVKWTQGFSPAAAHISAYGEMGFLWSLAVMAIGGFVLGILGALTRMGSGPLYVALGVASCTFAYYLSQLPIVATFTYGHGLFFLVLPIFIVFIASIERSSLKQMAVNKRSA